MAHAKWSPSSAHRWMECPASMAEELFYVRVNSSSFADEGTAAHTLLADCLLQKKDAAYYAGRAILVDTLDEQGLVIIQRSFTVDDEMIDNIQTVLDSVRARVADGWQLLVEQRVDFSTLIGIANQFGTADVILISPDGKHVSVEDLKYGRGHKVYPDNNHQMLTYAAGVIETFDGLLGEFETFSLRVHQPRLNFEAATEKTLTREDVLEHARKMKVAAAANAFCIARKLDGNLLNQAEYNPGAKQCLWCKHKPNCAAYEKMVMDEVMDDIIPIDALEQARIELQTNGPAPVVAQRLGQAFANLDMIEDWCKSVRAECERQVFAGIEVTGVDGQLMKIIEGRKGDRKWTDESAAEGLLVGALPPEKAYSPRKIISPSQAAKFLDKKLTRETWKNFENYITQAPGKPKVVEGSAPGVPWTGQVQDVEFVDLSTLE